MDWMSLADKKAYAKEREKVEAEQCELEVERRKHQVDFSYVLGDGGMTTGGVDWYFSPSLKGAPNVADSPSDIGDYTKIHTEKTAYTYSPDVEYPRIVQLLKVDLDVILALDEHGGLSVLKPYCDLGFTREDIKVRRVD
jgi:hypothetical protein